VTSGLLVSVVIPYFNADALLPETLGYVRAQTYAPIEIVIVDDGSKPASAARLTEIAKEASARVVTQANAGPAAARNLGAAEARGEYLAFLDADDIWAPHKIRKQVELARQNEGKVILTRTATITEDGAPVRIYRFDQMGPHTDILNMMLAGQIHSFTSALFLPRATFARLGGFNPKLRVREDHLLLIQALREVGFACVPEVLSSRRLHAASYSATARHVDARELLARQVPFAVALAAIEPGFDRNRFLAKEAFRIAKRKLVAGRRREARRIALKAIQLHPRHLKYWLMLPATVVAALHPSAFDHWAQEYAHLYRSGRAEAR
jgi:glycosyltransferase involved in cell wall biosynthesis